MSDGDWFAPKKFGLGSGLPIAWQGWVIMTLYLAVVTGTAGLLAPRHPGIALAVILPLTVAFMVICAQHTRGGWKWRNGGK